MPISVPTADEFLALQEEVDDLKARVLALEQQTEPPDPPDPEPGPEPPPGTLVITLQATATPYHGPGPFVYTEASGERLEDYLDPAGRFTVGLTRIHSAECDIVVDVMRYAHDFAEYVAVVMQRGTVDAANLNAFNQVRRGTKFGPYSVVVETAGAEGNEVLMYGETSEHYDGSEWRVCSWGEPDAWPFPGTPIAQLQALGVVGHYDGQLAALCPPPKTDFRYLPMQQSDGTRATPGYICGLRTMGGSTGVDSAIGLEGDEVSALLAGRTDMLSSVLEQAEAYHAYPWHRIDPATGANIQTCGSGAHLFKGGQVFKDGQKAISPRDFSTTTATIRGPVGTVIPTGTKVVAGNGVGWAMLSNPGAGGIPAAGAFTCNVQDQTSAYLPTASTASLEPPVAGCSVALALDGDNTAEGCDGISVDVNHSPSGGFLSFMLTGDPYHLKSVQAKASWHRAADPWTIGTSGQDWCVKQNFAMVSARHQAWFLRDIAEAVIATPADAPAWFQPKAVFQETLREMLAAYTYRWEHPANVGTTVVNNMDTAGNQPAASGYYNDYFALALIRAYVADAGWRPWMDRFLKNIIDRVNGNGGWCPGVPTFYAGLDFRNDVSWSDAWATLLASSYYSGPQSSGVAGLTDCPTELVFHPAGTNWNAIPTAMWLYAAMTRLQQVGYGGDAWGVAYDALVPAFKQAVLSGQFGATPMGWKFAFAP